MKKIKVNKKGKGKMSLEKEELKELKEALETVQKYDEKLQTKLLNKRRVAEVLDSIQKGLQEKEKVDLEHRLVEVEIKLSKLLNKIEK